ncbi:NB-ARC domain-containing protein [Streptomyces sp. NPDC097619]|uniref:NB-ARC domain-containing protein n=1 Tax=Streptomyces sp. NPDC097619 TaxID=3157228 RepID=UPI0033315BA5
MRGVVRGGLVWGAAALGAVVAVLASLAANAATGEDRWPGPLDALRQHPWAWVGGLAAAAVGVAVLAAVLSGGPAAGAGDPPPPPAVPVEDWVISRAEARQGVAAVAGRRRGGGAIGITTSLEGAGGFGKTTLAAMVCAHPRVRRRFRGRIYTVTIGRDVRSREEIAAKVTQATAFITGDATAFPDPDLAGDHLGRLLDARPRTLLVLDDVWEQGQLAPFLRGGKDCVRLVTTRVPAVLPEEAVRLRVDAMTPEQARAALTWRLPELPEGTVAGLLEATGRWAILLRLTNRLIAGQVSTGADPVIVADSVLARLRARGPASVDPDGESVEAPDLDVPSRRAQVVRATVEAATTRLPGEGASRYAELAVFVEDEQVPVALVLRLWAATGGLSEERGRALLGELGRLSLISLAPEGGGRIGLHDVLRDYLRGELGETRLRRLNRVLVEEAVPREWTEPWAWRNPVPIAEAVRAPVPGPESDGPAEAPGRRTPEEHDGHGGAPDATFGGYLLDHLVEHLLAAGLEARAERLAGSIRWVERRLAQRGSSAPWADLTRVPSPSAAALARDLSRTAHLLTSADPPAALRSTLYSRLGPLPHWDLQIAARLAARRADVRDPVGPLLVNRRTPPDLPDPSLLRTFTGWEKEVSAVLFARDGSWVAGADRAGEVRVYDTGTGDLVTVARTGARDPRALHHGTDHDWLSLIDGQGREHRLRPMTGEVRPEPRTRFVGGTALSASADGRLVVLVGSTGVPEVWSRYRRTLLRLPEAIGTVTTTAVTADGGRIALGYRGGTLYVIDPTLLHGALADPPPGPPFHAPQDGTGERPSSINALALAPGGDRCATGDYEGRVRLWSPPARTADASLAAHRGRVLALAYAPDGTRIASGGGDGALRVWAADAPAGRRGRYGARPVDSLAVAADGTLTTLESRTAWLWEGSRYPRTRLPHVPGIGTDAVVPAPDGSWVATTAQDGRTRLWNPFNGQVRRSWAGPPGMVVGLAAVPAPGARPGPALLVSATRSGAVLWDPASGDALRSFARPGTTAIAVSSDGARLAHAAGPEVRLHSLRAAGRPPGVLSTRLPAVRALAFDPAGDRLLTAGDDHLLTLWDTEGLAPLGTLDAGPGAGRVTAVAVSPDGRWIAATTADRAVRVWSSTDLRPVTGVRADGTLTSCAWTPEGTTLLVGGEHGLYAYEFLEA